MNTPFLGPICMDFDMPAIVEDTPEGKPGSARERVKHFNDQNLLDLQVWFFLAWTGEAARRLTGLCRSGRQG